MSPYKKKSRTKHVVAERHHSLWLLLYLPSKMVSKRRRYYLWFSSPPMNVLLFSMCEPRTNGAREFASHENKEVPCDSTCNYLSDFFQISQTLMNGRFINPSQEIPWSKPCCWSFYWTSSLLVVGGIQNKTKNQVHRLYEVPSKSKQWNNRR